MGCFSSKEDDQYKADLQTAKLLSLSGDEDRQARQEIEGKKAEINLSEKKQEKEEIRLEKPKDRGKRKQEGADDQEDEQLPKTDKETFKDEGQKMYPKDDVKKAVNPPPPPASIYDRGKSVIEGGNSVNPQGLCCQICQGPFAMNEIAKKGKYHIHCFKEHRNSICYVCKIKITEKGRKYKEHHFWKGKYCPDHENDGTSKCCSCERLEPQGESTYVMLDDYRWLCLECMGSSVMDSIESLPLHMDIRGFFESKELIIGKQFPLLMVDKQALNCAEKEEKIDNHRAVLTRGLCLSEVQTVTSIITRPTGRGPRNRLTGMVTEKQEVSGCEVTGILIIYGLPRLLTGYILAHEMMHAWLRLNGYINLKLELEEGLCQVLALMWLESHTFAFTEAEAASSSSSSSSSRTPLAATTSKKGDAWSDYEKRLQEFCIYQIKEDESPVYGQGFRKVYKMMRSNNYSVKDTLKEIVSASKTISKS